MTESSAETPGQVRVAAKKPDTVDRELIVSATKGGMEIALVEDGRLVEYQVAQEDSQFNVGDIYLGIVRKINPGLNAAFIDVGHEKDAFLHYTDLGPKFRSLFLFTQRAIKGTLRSHHPHDMQMEAEIVKTGKITQVLDLVLPRMCLCLFKGKWHLFGQATQHFSVIFVSNFM
jgi:ribonuclease G